MSRGSAAGMECRRQQLGGHIKDSSSCLRVRLLDYLFALARVLCKWCHPAIGWPAPNRLVRTCPDISTSPLRVVSPSNRLTSTKQTCSDLPRQGQLLHHTSDRADCSLPAPVGHQMRQHHTRRGLPRCSVTRVLSVEPNHKGLYIHTYINAYLYGHRHVNRAFVDSE